jgi:hypothetical protein
MEPIEFGSLSFSEVERLYIQHEQSIFLLKKQKKGSKKGTTDATKQKQTINSVK